MSFGEREDLIDEAIRRFDGIHVLQKEADAARSKRISFLYRSVFIGFGLMVAGLFSMVLVLSLQMSNMTHVVEQMNTYFSQMNSDMSLMLGAMARMDGNVDSMATIVRRMDDMNSSVDSMAVDMHEIIRRMGSMDQDMGQLSGNVTDMRESFHGMDNELGLMARMSGTWPARCVPSISSIPSINSIRFADFQRPAGDPNERA